MNDTKRQNLPAGLWIVATPIGNLEDLTLRARTALGQADLILCEDTRRTSVLLSALGFSHFTKKLERLDAHTPPQKMHGWVKKLQTGQNLALVTDAGTPGISDPGSLLVAAAHEAAVRVTPIPGASAVVSLLSVSGFQDTAFTFRGYFPRKPQDQITELELASSSRLARVHVWFESPLRIRKALAVLSEAYPEAGIIAAKELTKIHERLFHGSATQVTQAICHELDTQGEVGEWCFAVQFPEIQQGVAHSSSEWDESLDWVKALKCLLAASVPVSEASKQVSQHFGISKRISYDVALQILGKKSSKGG